MNRINPLSSVEDAAAEWDRREMERRKGALMRDSEDKSIWHVITHSPVFAPLLVTLIVGAVAAAAGLLALPATVQSHSTRIEKVEGRVDSIERSDIGRAKDLEQIARELANINTKLDKIDERERRR